MNAFEAVWEIANFAVKIILICLLAIWIGEVRKDRKK